jgi:class 3 adenylate cyclase
MQYEGIKKTQILILDEEGLKWLQASIVNDIAPNCPTDLIDRHRVIFVKNIMVLGEILSDRAYLYILIVGKNFVNQGELNWFLLSLEKYPNLLKIFFSLDSQSLNCLEGIIPQSTKFDYLIEPWNFQELETIFTKTLQGDRSICCHRSVESSLELLALDTANNPIPTVPSPNFSSLETDTKIVSQNIFTAIPQELGIALGVDGCALSLWTKTDEFVRCVGLYDRNSTQQSEQLPQSLVPISQNPVLQKLIATNQPVAIADMQTSPHMNQFDLPLRSPARALLIVPLIFQGEIIGSISLRQTACPRRWRKSEIALARAAASQAALALEQVRLYDRVKDMNHYLTESVLKRFLPPTMVKSAAIGELNLDLHPESRPIAILFSDLVGFTQLSAELGPIRIAALVNEYLENMTKAAIEHGGTVDKFIGDAVVALFGAPENLSPCEQVRRAVSAARNMHARMQKLNQHWQEQCVFANCQTLELQLRCGIHHGHAVVGMFGNSQRSEYTAIGPAVNLAARLQAAAVPNSIMVSCEVVNYLNSAEVAGQEYIKFKGIDEELLCFYLYP